MGDRLRGFLAGLLAALTVAGVLVAFEIVPSRTGRARPATPAAGPESPESRPPDSPARAAPGPPVLAVKIDNAPAARPPVGLGAADIVYVEPVEGGLSRLVAVYGAREPAVVGPVRSARKTDLQLLAQFDRPALAFSGAAPELLPRIAAAPVVNVSQNRVPGAYFRDGSRTAPHNLFVRPARLPQGRGGSAGAALPFGPAPPGGVPTRQHEVDYRSATMGFTWSPQQQRWLVSMDGAAHVGADGDRMAASTVVIKRVPVRASSITDSAGNPSPFASTVGRGTALVLRDGLAFEVRWSRPSPRARTDYTTAAGVPVAFARGQVWVVLAPD